MSTTGEPYASDYFAFLADVYGGERRALQSLEDTVWKQAIDYYRTHSNFEGAADGTTRAGSVEVDRIEANQ